MWRITRRSQMILHPCRSERVWKPRAWYSSQCTIPAPVRWELKYYFTVYEKNQRKSARKAKYPRARFEARMPTSSKLPGGAVPRECLFFEINAKHVLPNKIMEMPRIGVKALNAGKKGRRRKLGGIMNLTPSQTEISWKQRFYADKLGWRWPNGRPTRRTGVKESRSDGLQEQYETCNKATSHTWLRRHSLKHTFQRNYAALT